MNTHPQAQRVFLALGSNLGERENTLSTALMELELHFGQLKVSSFRESEPQNCPEGSPPFINACVELRTTKPPMEVLRLCQEIERQLGRVRTGVYGEARSCDIDIISYGEVQLSTPELTLPHPRAHERDFVISPLHELDSHFCLPGQSLTVSQLLTKIRS